MDITTLFKANARTISLRNKELEDYNNTLKIQGKTVNKQKSPFLLKVQNIINQINKLQKLLLEKRIAYLNVSQHLSSNAKTRMTDAERDEIDKGVHDIMRTCSQLIKDLKREVAASYEDVSQQNIEHREIILILMDNYLEKVCKIYSEQKAIRVKRALEMRKMSKLNLERIDHIEKENKKPSLNEMSETTSFKVQELNGDIHGSGSSNLYEEELSPEDIQLLESENEHLYHELTTITEEVRHLESKVVHIAELQEMFTEKVLDQDKNLDRLMTTVVGSTENVKEANEQIRQAIQRNAGLRVWMLFFLLIMSFSLLFLDWYNP